MKDSWQVMMKRHSGSSSVWFEIWKEKRKGKSRNTNGSRQRGGFKTFRKSGSGGKANMANETTPRHIGKERRERKEIQNCNTPTIWEQRHDNGNGKADTRKENPKRLQPSQRNKRRSTLPHSRLLDSIP